METVNPVTVTDTTIAEHIAALRIDVEAFDIVRMDLSGSLLRSSGDGQNSFSLVEELVAKIDHPQHAEKLAQRRLDVVLHHVLIELEEFAAREQLSAIQERLKATIQRVSGLLSAETDHQSESREQIWILRSLFFKAISRANESVALGRNRPNVEWRESGQVFPRLVEMLRDKVSRLPDDQSLSRFVAVQPFKWHGHLLEFRTNMWVAENDIGQRIKALLKKFPLQSRHIPSSWSAYPATVRMIELSREIERIVRRIDEEFDIVSRELFDLRKRDEEIAALLQVPTQAGYARELVARRTEQLPLACLAIERYFTAQRDLAVHCQQLHASIPKAHAEYPANGRMESAVRFNAPLSGLLTVYRAHEQLERATSLLRAFVNDGETARSYFEIVQAIGRQVKRVLRQGGIVAA